jgi:shikimate dehydrogenase
VISGTTRVFALLGNPVAHSLSPALQNAAFRALGLDAVYVPIRCEAEDVPVLLRAIARSGGGGNVTVPHKETAARAVELGRPLVDRLRACNTFWSEEGRVVGDNTDVTGVLAELDRLAPSDGAAWLIAGTGGAARAAAAAAQERSAPIAVLSRDEDRRAAFERWAASLGLSLAPPADCCVLLNATPLGLRPQDPLPIPPDLVPHAEVALDLVYAPSETRWVRVLRANGVRASDGRGMLVAQGAAAFERWFPGLRAPVEIMRAAVDAALR